MKRTFKRCISLLLAVMMVLGASPIGALSEIDFSSFADLFSIKAAATTYGGKCGDNLSWSYSFNGNSYSLVISGTGDMSNWTESLDSPWRMYYGYEGRLTIGDGVTSIGDYAFVNLDGLVRVTIPDSVKSIGARAFRGCDGLHSVTIGSSVRSIGSGAFCDCADLRSITIPDGVNSIKDSTFFLCTSLSSVTIPNSVKSIGTDAFYYCKDISDVYFGGTKEQWKEIYIGANNKYLTEATIHFTEPPHEHVYTSKVTVPTCTEAGFTTYTCSCGDSYISDETESLGHTEGEWEILIDSTAEQEGEKVKKCTVCGTVLETAVVPVKTVVSGMFGENLTWTLDKVTGELVISGKGDMINDSPAPWMKYWEIIKTVTISDGVTSIGDHAFEGTMLETVTIPNSVTSIGISSFEYCINLKSLVIPDSVTSIGYGAVYECYNLENVKIGNGVTSIGDRAFQYCRKLAKVEFGESVTSIGENAFLGCDSLTSIEIPESVTSIGVYAFFECTNLINITIGNSVASIGQEAFGFCRSLTSIKVDDNNAYYSSDEDGVLFNKDKTELIQYPIGKTSESYIIPVSVTSISCAAFEGCDRLTSVTFPDSVSNIGDYAFSSCDNLKDVYYYGTAKQWDEISIGVNNKHLTEATMHFHEHLYISEVTAPTCTEAGFTTYTCSCGDSYIDDETEATGHTSGNWQTTVNATCTTEGTKMKICAVCGETVETEKIPSKGHSYESVVTVPTCTESGFTIHTCFACGDTYKDSEINAMGHNYESMTTKNPSCIETGIKTFTCRCGDSYTEIILANGHTKGDWKYIGGKQYAKFCTVCGEKLESKNVTVNLMFDGQNVNSKSLLNKSTCNVTVKVTDDLSTDVAIVSSDDSIVSVDADGKVTANDVGTAIITATIIGSEITDSIEITVLPREFTITWIVNGVITTQTIKEYEKIIPCVNTNVEGYLFRGWTANVPDAMLSNDLIFTAILEKIVPTSARITKIPVKTEYIYKRDKFDLSGIEIEVTYTDGTKETVTDTSMMKVSDFTNEKRGEQNVTIEYEGVKTNCKVNVKYTWWQWILVILLFGWIWY